MKVQSNKMSDYFSIADFHGSVVIDVKKLIFVCLSICTTVHAHANSNISLSLMLEQFIFDSFCFVFYHAWQLKMMFYKLFDENTVPA